MTNPHAAAADHDKIESADGGIGASILRILKLLARPELSKWRPIMVIAILITLAASVLEVISPLLLGHAINRAVPEGGEAAAFGASGETGDGVQVTCRNPATTNAIRTMAKKMALKGNSVSGVRPNTCAYVRPWNGERKGSFTAPSG